jgi:hypothetical protein
MTVKVDELIAHLKSLSDHELWELSATPEWALFMHKVYRIRPGEPLTLERIEMDAQICRQWPASTEYYEAQVELNRQRMTRHSRV